MNSSLISKEIWNDSRFENILLLSEYVYFKTPFRLSKGNKIVASLNNISGQVWHQGYNMFREWNLNGHATGEEIIDAFLNQIPNRTKYKVEINKKSKRGGQLVTKIRFYLLKVMENYMTAKQKPFKEHQLGILVRNDIPNEFEKINEISTDKYLVSASVGQGNWAHVPWIAIMNKQITTSTQRGYYIVYLFSEDMSRVYLTIAQGVTETMREEMEKVKKGIQSTVPEDSKVKIDDGIDLGDSKRAKDYAFSTAAYIRYDYNTMPSEETLLNDLKHMLEIYENYIEKEQKATKSSDILLKEEIKEDIVLYEGSQGELVDHIYKYIRGKGFLYSKEEVTNLYLSLKTKPFVILSGISGTGKTMIGKWFAESLGATEKNGQLSIIPVRPDWNDGSDLLGYTDIKGDFQDGPLTKILKRAVANPEKPYFVILDEMNLARVEYYFSDLLSIMETRRWKNGRIVSSALLSEEIAGEEVYIPENFYVIGTVNMDETTHPFSKKVLDRANTIEFNDVNLNNLSFLKDIEEIESERVNQGILAAKYLHLKDLYKDKPDLVARISDELTTINQYLEKTQAHIGYRVRDEICFYLAYNEEVEYFTVKQAMDYCILQKVLPRISGSDSRVDELLKMLYQYFTNRVYDEELEDFIEDLETANYPQSAKKVLEMLRRLEEDGFTSFWVT